MILHISQLSGAVVPVAGWAVPVLLWQLKKTEMPALDEHGKMVVNWIISELIYAVAGVILTVVLIGIPMLVVLGLASVIFPIIGAVKANNGELWNYPLTLKILK